MSATGPSVNSETISPKPLGPAADEPSLSAAHEAGRRQELESRRERLTERFALMQSELGGLFYEMAIRDHLQLELLIDRAAALQRLEDELRRVEQELAQS
jgi:hypothetical protein